MLPVLLGFSTLYAAPVPVRFVEGSAHGFLVLRSMDGDTLGQGELLQVPGDGEIETRLVFHFKDGSLYDETVVFSQRKVFALRRYRLVQRGPSFPTTLDASLDRATERYKVTYKKEDDHAQEILEDSLDLPADVYNGMQAQLLKNLPKGATETVHFVAFTPKPQLIELTLAPAGEDSFLLGETKKKAHRYALKPQLGPVIGFFASLVGKDPPDFFYWLLDGEAPGFLAFEGPLYVEGPIWRIELTSPRWPKSGREP
ncbi:MAG: hypothetical protein H0V35_04230 [Nitrospira sp.]|nr:hypothetical protein [Nitrospira sp.]